MGVIDAEHASPARRVKREGIADAVRPINIRRYALRDDLDPVAAADFCEKAIKVEKSLKGPVAPHHRFNISYTDN